MRRRCRNGQIRAVGPRRRVAWNAIAEARLLLCIISINQANSINHQVKTLVHELSHALLRHTDLGDVKLSYSHEELVVESIALTVVGGLGLDTSGYSIPYLTSWSQNDDSLEIIATCAGVIDRLAKRIEDAIGPAPEAD